MRAHTATVIHRCLQIGLVLLFLHLSRRVRIHEIKRHIIQPMTPRRNERGLGDVRMIQEFNADFIFVTLWIVVHALRLMSRVNSKHSVHDFGNVYLDLLTVRRRVFGMPIGFHLYSHPIPASISNTGTEATQQFNLFGDKLLPRALDAKELGGAAKQNDGAQRQLLQDFDKFPEIIIEASRHRRPSKELVVAIREHVVAIVLNHRNIIHAVHFMLSSPFGKQLFTNLD